MKIRDLLDEIKLGDKNFKELKIDESIEEDSEVLEEGEKYIRVGKRIEKLNEALKEKFESINELSPITTKVGRLASTFETVDYKNIRGIQLTKAQARAKVVSLKKNYDALVQEARDRDLMRMIIETRAVQPLGEVLGTTLYATKKLEEIAETTVASSLQKRTVPSYLKADTNTEIRALTKTEEQIEE